MAKVKVSELVTESVTRSPIELFWTARNCLNYVFVFMYYTVLLSYEKCSLFLIGGRKNCLNYVERLPPIFSSGPRHHKKLLPLQNKTVCGYQLTVSYYNISEPSFLVANFHLCILQPFCNLKSVPYAF